MKITGFRVSLWTHHHNHCWYLATSMRQKEENVETAVYTFKYLALCFMHKENQVGRRHLRRRCGSSKTKSFSDDDKQNEC